MGLDMYLRAKTTKRDYNGATGACSGILDMAPDDEGMVEIGYWRKAYDQDYVIQDVCGGCDNCENVLLSKENIEEILAKAKEILETHTFDEEDGWDTTPGHSTDLCWMGDTWQSERKWEDTVRFFTDALTILNEDPDAEIYYCIWY